MNKPDHVILVCCSFRRGKDPMGKCHKKGAPDLLGPLQQGLEERGLENCIVSTTGCLNICDQGPVMAVYPEGYWYGGVTEDSLEEILDALQEKRSADAHRIA